MKALRHAGTLETLEPDIALRIRQVRAVALCIRPEFAMFGLGQHCCPNWMANSARPFLTFPVSGMAAGKEACAASRRDEGASDGGAKTANCRNAA